MSRRSSSSPPGAPAHLLAVAGDRRSLCGLKDPLPRVLVRHAPAHMAGYGMEVCDNCAAVAWPRGQQLTFEDGS